MVSGGRGHHRRGGRRNRSRRVAPHAAARGGRGRRRRARPGLLRAGERTAGPYGRSNLEHHLCPATDLSSDDEPEVIRLDLPVAGNSKKVADTFVRDLTTDPWHMVAGAVGVVGGYFVARYRARIMYVRPLPEYQAIIVRRSFAEYIVVIFLITVKLLSENTTLHNYGVSLFITAGLLLLLSESALRIVIVYRRYRRETVDARAAIRVLKKVAKTKA